MIVKMSEPQADFAFSESPHPAFFGGFGAGKSQAGTIRLIHLITQDPGSDVSHFFPSYRLAKRRGFQGTINYLKALGIDYTVNKSDLTIFLPEFGSTIYMETYHDPDAIVSFEVAHAVIDELDTLAKDQAEHVWQKVTERVRQKCKHPAGNTLGCVSTPDQGTAGFCFELWGNGERLADGYHYIKAGTRSNKFLPEGYADQIAKNYDPVMAEAFLDGGWVSFTRNKVYHFFSRTKHHTDREILPSDTMLHIGLDFNIGGCCAVTFVVDGANPVAVDEFTSHDTRDFVNNLARYKDKTCLIYPDVASGFARHTNAAQTDIAIITQAGYQIKAGSTNPAIRDRINAVNALLAHDRFSINTRKCPNLTNALETQGYNERGEPEKWAKHPAIDDWNDSFGYFLSRNYPIIRPLVQARFGGT
jgi:hypothetical protein